MKTLIASAVLLLTACTVAPAAPTRTDVHTASFGGRAASWTMAMPCVAPVCEGGDARYSVSGGAIDCEASAPVTLTIYCP